MKLSRLKNQSLILKKPHMRLKKPKLLLKKTKHSTEEAKDFEKLLLNSNLKLNKPGLSVKSIMMKLNKQNYKK